MRAGPLRAGAPARTGRTGSAAAGRTGSAERQADRAGQAERRAGGSGGPNGFGGGGCCATAEPAMAITTENRKRGQRGEPQLAGKDELWQAFASTLVHEVVEGCAPLAGRIRPRARPFVPPRRVKRAGTTPADSVAPRGSLSSTISARWRLRRPMRRVEALRPPRPAPRPAARARQSAPAPAARTAGAGSRNPADAQHGHPAARILIVDDEANARAALVRDPPRGGVHDRDRGRRLQGARQARGVRARRRPDRPRRCRGSTASG